MMTRREDDCACVCVYVCVLVRRMAVIAVFRKAGRCSSSLSVSCGFFSGFFVYYLSGREREMKVGPQY